VTRTIVTPNGTVYNAKILDDTKGYRALAGNTKKEERAYFLGVVRQFEEAVKGWVWTST
jgi:hypothetical protein